MKLSSPGGRRSTFILPGGERYQATFATLRFMIVAAYRVRPDEVTGGPAWIDSEHYEMNSKAERPSTAEELHVMLQSLLADDFKLQFHHETKELPVYALVVDKDGLKMTPSETKVVGQTHETNIDIIPDPNPGQSLRVTYRASKTPMSYLAWILTLSQDRHVIDLTHLTASYDFDLPFTREPPPGVTEGTMLNGAPVDTSGPTIFEAVRKLGLRLERQKGPVEIMVVDHAEKPAIN